MRWHHSLGLSPERLRYKAHEQLAHYARAAFDIEFDFGGTLGFQEIEGIHNRTDFDLGRHQEYSGKKLEYFDQPKNKRYVPFVIETSVGADRVTLAALVNAYREEAVEGEDEGPRRPRPASVARADQGRGVRADEEGRAAGHGAPHRRRAAATLPGRLRRDREHRQAVPRQDEVGTPFCITGGRRLDEGRHRDGARPRHTQAGPDRRRFAAHATWSSASPT
jgi:glycyl-tRNA synthetase